MLINGEARAHRVHFRAHLRCIARKVAGDFAQPVRNLHHFRLAETARRHSRRADADAACDKRLLRVIWNGIFVDSDLHLVQTLLKFLSGDVEIPHVHKAEVVVRSAGNEPEALFNQLFRKHPCIFYHLRAISLKLRLKRLAKADGLCSDDMLQWAAL